MKYPAIMDFQNIKWEVVSLWDNFIVFNYRRYFVDIFCLDSVPNKVFVCVFYSIIHAKA